MVKFEDLEVGKEYILIDTGTYTYPADFYYMERITIIKKCRALPMDTHNSILETKAYDEITYLLNSSLGTISTYKDRHLKCTFIGTNEDLKKEIEPFITKYTLEKSNCIKERYEQEKKDLENNMAEIRKSVLELIEEE